MSKELSLKALNVSESSTLAISAKAKAMKQQGKTVINLSVGEPDFDTPNHIKAAAINAIETGFTKYTESSGTLSLREAICEKLKQDNGLEYTPAQIVVSNGAKHSLTNIFSAILNPKDEVIIPAPYWLSYPEMAKLAGGQCKFVYADMSENYKITPKLLAQVLSPKTKAIVLNSPSNPTGMVYTKNELEDIANFAIEHDLFVISDEIYEKLIYDGNKHYSIASFGKEIYDRTIVVNGFSKSYSMTGWRIGYTASNLQLAKVMGNVQSHQTSNPCSIAQKGAEEALRGSQDCIAVMHTEFDKRREYMYERLSKMPGVRMLKPEGAFYLFIDISSLVNKKHGSVTINNATDFAMLLLEHALVATVPCADFGFPNHIRISYAADIEEIKTGVDRIEELLQQIK